MALTIDVVIIESEGSIHRLWTEVLNQVLTGLTWVWGEVDLATEEVIDEPGAVSYGALDQERIYRLEIKLVEGGKANLEISRELGVKNGEGGSLGIMAALVWTIGIHYIGPDEGHHAR